MKKSITLRRNWQSYQEAPFKNSLGPDGLPKNSLEVSENMISVFCQPFRNISKIWDVSDFVYLFITWRTFKKTGGPSNFTPRICQETWATYPHKGLYANVHSSIIQNSPNCPPTVEKINKCDTSTLQNSSIKMK